MNKGVQSPSTPGAVANATSTSKAVNDPTSLAAQQQHVQMIQQQQFQDQQYQSNIQEYPDELDLNNTQFYMSQLQNVQNLSNMMRENDRRHQIIGDGGAAPHAPPHPPASMPMPMHMQMPMPMSMSDAYYPQQDMHHHFNQQQMNPQMPPDVYFRQPFNVILEFYPIKNKILKEKES